MGQRQGALERDRDTQIPSQSVTLAPGKSGVVLVDSTHQGCFAAVWCEVIILASQSAQGVSKWCVDLAHGPAHSRAHCYTLRRQEGVPGTAQAPFSVCSLT